MSERKYIAKAVDMPDPVKILLASDEIEGLVVDLNMVNTEYGLTAEILIITSDGKENKLNQRHSGGDAYRNLFSQMKGKTLPLLIKATISKGWDGREYEIKVPTAAQLKTWFKSS